MSLACVNNASMSGSVPHHAGHIIGYTSGEDPQPIDCSGHSVTGNVNNPGQNKLFIQGKKALVSTGSGSSTDPCDGSDFKPSSYSSSMFIQGKPIVRVGDEVSLNPGSGKMVTANQSKFYVRR